jgi:hypothetical protein
VGGAGRVPAASRFRDDVEDDTSATRRLAAAALSALYQRGRTRCRSAPVGPAALLSAICSLLTAKELLHLVDF